MNRFSCYLKDGHWIYKCPWMASILQLANSRRPCTLKLMYVFFHSIDLQLLKKGEGIHYLGIEYRFFVPPYDNVRASRPVLGQLAEIQFKWHLLWNLSRECQPKRIRICWFREDGWLGWHSARGHRVQPRASGVVRQKGFTESDHP